MGKIRLLDDHIANQIAAGEVVERPSSVVKELVENSIDAGSTRIEVTLEEGGIHYIRVKDNGAGMDGEDCKMAFFRHATSKISSGKDLFRIRSLGFRGEALPSIAAVAKVECLTSPDTSGLGRRMVVEGSNIVVEEDAASARGTDIHVRELFYNTPARLKYMKTIQTELGHVSDYMYRLALAHPGIAFSLKHNGNSLLHTMGNGDLLQAIAAVYGTAAAKQMIAVREETPDYRIAGFLARPEWTRANRFGISTLINGRYIRNYALVQSILKGYHTLLPINRFPLAVLHIDMSPELVDVNVHPSKLEVRFSKEAELTQSLEEAVRGTLHQEVLIPQGSKPAAKKPVVREQIAWYGDDTAAPPGSPAAGPASGAAAPGQAPAPAESAASGTDKPASAGLSGAPEAGPAAAGPPFPAAEPGSAGAARAPARSPEPPLVSGGSGDGGGTYAAAQRSHGRTAMTGGAAAAHGGVAARGGPGRAVRPGAGSASSAAGTARYADGMRPPAAELEPGNGTGPGVLPAFPRLTPIGQLHGTYILAQNEEGLYMIDQHAAHERINYEYYYEKFGKPQEASQELLVPLTLDFTSAEAEVLKERLDWFEKAGVYLESFGGSSFIVRAYPHWFPAGEEKGIIDEMAEWILSEKKQLDLAKLREKSSTLCSCKASIKANQSLTRTEMEALLARLAACRIPYTCPHGRPIVVSFSTYELEKMFKRVM